MEAMANKMRVAAPSGLADLSNPARPHMITAAIAKTAAAPITNTIRWWPLLFLTTNRLLPFYIGT
jgi:hypothetical protein